MNKKSIELSHIKELLIIALFILITGIEEFLNLMEFVLIN